jgi:hypothetical protein
LTRLNRLANRPDNWDYNLNNFVPTGKIDTAEVIRSKYLTYNLPQPSISPKKVITISYIKMQEDFRRQISYSLQLLEFYDWFFETKRTDGVIKNLLIRQAIIMVGSVAEALCIYFLMELNYIKPNSINFIGAIDTLHCSKIIPDNLYKSLKDLKEERDYIHIHLVLGFKNKYEKDYFNHRVTLEKLAKSLKNWGSTPSP